MKHYISQYRRHVFAVLFLVSLCGGGTSVSATEKTATARPPDVVASIAPLHSLASALMGGAEEPLLLLKGKGSPHDYALKPSQARALRRADVIFWMGANLEGFLVKPVAARESGQESARRDLPLLSRLAEEPDRRPRLIAYGKDEAHGHGDDHAHGEEKASDGEFPMRESGDFDLKRVNPHVWLDPAMTKELVAFMAQELGAADPARQSVYERNAEKLLARLDELDGELTQVLAPVKGERYVVMHNAYPYFVRRYGLAAPLVVTDIPENRPGGKHLRKIREEIAEAKPACLFTEPASSRSLVPALLEGTGMKVATLDPLGADLKKGPDQYFEMMRRLGRTFRDCLFSDDTP